AVTSSASAASAVRSADNAALGIAAACAVSSRTDSVTMGCSFRASACLRAVRSAAWSWFVTRLPSAGRRRSGRGSACPAGLLPPYLLRALHLHDDAVLDDGGHGAETQAA